MCMHQHRSQYQIQHNNKISRSWSNAKLTWGSAISVQLAVLTAMAWSGSNARERTSFDNQKQAVEKSKKFSEYSSGWREASPNAKRIARGLRAHFSVRMWVRSRSLAFLLLAYETGQTNDDDIAYGQITRAKWPAHDARPTWKRDGRPIMTMTKQRIKIKVKEVHCHLIYFIRNISKHKCFHGCRTFFSGQNHLNFAHIHLRNLFICFSFRMFIFIFPCRKSCGAAPQHGTPCANC